MRFRKAKHNPMHDVNSCCCVDCCWERQEADKKRKERKKGK